VVIHNFHVKRIFALPAEANPPLENIEHRTSNAEHPSIQTCARHSMFDVGRSMFDVPPKFNPGSESRLQAVLARCRLKAGLQTLATRPPPLFAG
jgi:hypothetical protein